MKPDELMIGDWVFHPDLCYCIRVECLGLVDVFWNHDGAMSSVPYDTVQPYEIDEIFLRENGFVLLEVGDNGAATPAQYRNRFEKWMLHTKWQDVILWYDRRTKTYNLHNMNGARFRHVHQLQHAMKLAGIGKDVEL